jgi:membrane-associated progesterone receptor component
MFKFAILVFLTSVSISYLIMYLKNNKWFSLKGNCFKCNENLPKVPGRNKIIPNSTLKPGEWTLEDLLQYDGITKREILLAVDWRVFDVTSSTNLYGPGGSYEYLAGRDATRSIILLYEIKMPKSKVQDFDDYEDFTNEQRDSLNDWVDYFYSKYPEVGLLVKIKSKEPKYQEIPVGTIEEEMVFSTGLNK